MDLRVLSPPSDSLLDLGKVGHYLRIDPTSYPEIEMLVLSAQEFLTKNLNKWIGVYELQAIFSFRELTMENPRRRVGFTEYLHGQGYTGASLNLNQQLESSFVELLDVNPVRKITEVAFFKDFASSARLLVDGVDYFAHLDRSVPVVELKELDLTDAANYIRIKFESGYDRFNLPNDLQLTLLKITALLFENRGDITENKEALAEALSFASAHRSLRV